MLAYSVRLDLLEQNQTGGQDDIGISHELDSKNILLYHLKPLLYNGPLISLEYIITQGSSALVTYMSNQRDNPH
ncbi:hypothetical protein ACJX0J_021673, partial [Zea mays]